ncbi:MAG: Holliday junction resolvase RuvX [Chlamydiales bacterium]|nr:Holliday junction resolvase RuvX [Chlamydiales bacterium]
MRIMSIDYGRKRIGVAISDHLKILASPLTTIEAKKTMEETVLFFIKEIKEIKETEKIIIGLPLNMNGSESEMSKEVKEFGKLLETHAKIPVDFFDERLSSKGVDLLLRDQQLNRKERTKKLDTAAASLMLQTYLHLHFS